MSSHEPGRYAYSCNFHPSYRLFSNGDRDFQMDYENIIDSNSEQVDKEKQCLHVEEQQEHSEVLSRFELVDDLDVHLEFDDENWESHFSREESSVLGLESGSQNLDFVSSAKTCAVNVWSEATSSESVQMLLNSVGHDIGSVIEDRENLNTERGSEAFDVAKMESSHRIAETTQQREGSFFHEHSKEDAARIQVEGDVSRSVSAATTSEDALIEHNPLSLMDVEGNESAHSTLLNASGDTLTEKDPSSQENYRDLAGQNIVEESSRSLVKLESIEDTAVDHKPSVEDIVHSSDVKSTACNDITQEEDYEPEMNDMEIEKSLKEYESALQLQNQDSGDMSNSAPSTLDSLPKSEMQTENPTRSDSLQVAKENEVILPGVCINESSHVVTKNESNNSAEKGDTEKEASLQQRSSIEFFIDQSQCYSDNQTAELNNDESATIPISSDITPSMVGAVDGGQTVMDITSEAISGDKPFQNFSETKNNNLIERNEVVAVNSGSPENIIKQSQARSSVNTDNKTDTEEISENAVNSGEDLFDPAVNKELETSAEHIAAQNENEGSQEGYLESGEGKSDNLIESNEAAVVNSESTEDIIEQTQAKHSTGKQTETTESTENAVKSGEDLFQPAVKEDLETSKELNANQNVNGQTQEEYPGSGKGNIKVEVSDTTNTQSSLPDVCSNVLPADQVVSRTKRYSFEIPLKGSETKVDNADAASNIREDMAEDEHNMIVNHPQDTPMSDQVAVEEDSNMMIDHSEDKAINVEVPSLSEMLPSDGMPLKKECDNIPFVGKDDTVVEKTDVFDKISLPEEQTFEIAKEKVEQQTGSEECTFGNPTATDKDVSLMCPTREENEDVVNIGISVQQASNDNCDPDISSSQQNLSKEGEQSKLETSECVEHEIGSPLFVQEVSDKKDLCVEKDIDMADGHDSSPMEITISGPAEVSAPFHDKSSPIDAEQKLNSPSENSDVKDMKMVSKADGGCSDSVLDEQSQGHKGSLECISHTKAPTSLQETSNSQLMDAAMASNAENETIHNFSAEGDKNHEDIKTQGIEYADTEDVPNEVSVSQGLENKEPAVSQAVFESKVTPANSVSCQEPLAVSEAVVATILEPSIDVPNNCDGEEKKEKLHLLDQQQVEIISQEGSRNVDIKESDPDTQHVGNQDTKEIGKAELTEHVSDQAGSKVASHEQNILRTNSFEARNDEGKNRTFTKCKDNEDAMEVSLSSVNSEGIDKHEHESGDSGGRSIPQGGDTFTFDTGAKNTSGEKDLDASLKFPESDIEANAAGCWKPFQSSQSSKENPSTAHISGTVQLENHESSEKAPVIEISGTGQKIFTHNSPKEIENTNTDSGKKSETEMAEVPPPTEGFVRPENRPVIDTTEQKQKDSPSTSFVVSSQPMEASVVSSSTAPDLNTLTAPSVAFQQPFTDAQQVQLRAQILVYGSLIQGSLPEEDLMLTAFADIGASQGGTSSADGSRAVWESTWRVAADRIARKLHPNSSNIPAALSNKVTDNPKSPTPALAVNMIEMRNSASGNRPTEMAASRAPHMTSRTAGSQNLGRTPTKNNHQTIMNSSHNMTISSPIWSMPTAPNDNSSQGQSVARNLHLDPHPMAAARHLYQPPQFGHFSTMASSSRLSPLPLPAPWGNASQGTLPESPLQMSSFALPEVQQDVLSGRRTPVPSTSYATKMPVTGSHFGTIPTGSKVTIDVSKAPSGRQSNSEQKPGRRKKKSVSTDLVSTSPLTLSSSQAQPNFVMSNHQFDPVTAASVGSSLVLSMTPSTASLPVISTSIVPAGAHYQVISKGETGQRIIFSEETATRIEQARLSAEDAASVAANAVRHSQGIWSQLALQEDSGLVTNSEAKLASAAVAAAAAASVSKAAAAAAQLAADAALQAKMMANEALNFDSRGGDSSAGAGGQGQSYSIIATAREAAKKRIEDVAAAAKRAENLDAIVRAAELAAQAVSQAGAVIAMGDPVPLPLTTLLEAGPEAYWKLFNKGTDFSRDNDTNSKSLAKHTDVMAEENNNRNDKVARSTKSKDKRELSKGDSSGPKQSENQLISRDQITANDSNVQTSFIASNGKKRKAAIPFKSDEIREGSLVEVVSDEEGLRGVWFAAKVLNLKDGKAYVRYDELLADDGINHLQEWIPLEGENGKAPRIRTAHPMTVMKFEGTRKRRREAMGNFVWSVGDHVDAWMRDGWWEGVITAKNEKDDSKVTVHFPGEGDTSVIKAWNLRPSLIWKDGQWIEWTLLKSDGEFAHEVDYRYQKRQKVDVIENFGEVKGRDRAHRVPNIEEAKKIQELNTVMSSCKDISFGLQKPSDDRVSGNIKVNHMGLLKEGSKVVFGVPKPTKKRKFMDVSKHYDVDPLSRSSSDMKTTNKSEKIKIPVTSSHNEWKPTTKTEDRYAKKTLIPKPRVPRFHRNHEAQVKMKFGKDKSSHSNALLAKEVTSQDMGLALSSILDGNTTGSKIGGSELHISSTQKGAEATFSSIAKESMSRRRSPSRGVKISGVDMEPVSRSKQSSLSDSSNLVGEKAIILSEVSRDRYSEKGMDDRVEPRRSNRKIQPTSRLLEGLQTSPSITKGSVHLAHERGRGHSKASAFKGSFRH